LETTISGVLRAEGSEDPISGAYVAAQVRFDNEVLAATVTDADGSFTLRVPAGQVDLLAGKVGWPYAGGGEEPELVVTNASQDVSVELTLPPTGTLQVTAASVEEFPLPAHVIVVGRDPSPPFEAVEPWGMDPLPPGISRMMDLPVSGSDSIQLEPGEYDIVVMRGMEYDVHVESVTVISNEVVTIDATLTRVLDTAGMLCGDFHIHAAVGPDTELTDDDRVANFAAEGMEVLVPSNHAFVVDFAPMVARLGLDGWVATINSQEVTTFDYGHFGLFPMPIDEQAPNGEALDWVGKSPVDIFDWADAQDWEMVVQINHPRAIPTPVDTQNYFTVLDLKFDQDGWYYGPEYLGPEVYALPADAEMFGSGFTAMEVMTWLNVQGLSDWFNLLNAGHYFTGTANTDSHTVRVESAGWPRNYIHVGIDDPTQLDEAAFVAAVNGLKLSGAFGVLVELSAENTLGIVGGQGDVLDTEGQVVTVRARIQAPTWVPVDMLDIYLGGELVVSEVLVMGETAGAEGGTRTEETVEVEIPVSKDSWVVAIAHGSESLFPFVPFNKSDPDGLTLEMLREGQVEEPATAFGFVNPVFLDADGDGAITPSHDVIVNDFLDYRRENRLEPY
jgi:hypothetical protein